MKEPIKLSQFRTMMTALGYKVKSKTVSFHGLGYGSGLVVEVYDGPTLINTSIMTEQHRTKYKDVFDVLTQYKITA